MKYSPETTEKLVKHLKKGSTITSACQAVGISRETFYDWMDKKPDFSDTIKKAMAIPDRKVENSLFKQAKGFFKVKEKHFEVEKDGKKQLVKVIEKVVLPNVTATIFYLKNKKPDEFKDRHNLDLSGDMNIKVISAVPRSKKRKKNATS